MQPVIARVAPRFTRLVRESLLFRFSVLSATVLILIAVGLGLVLERQVEHDALIRQADEVAVVVQDVLGNGLTAETFTGQPRIGSQTRWAAKSRRLLLADGHVVRVKVWDTTGRVIFSNNPAQIGQSYPIDDNLRTALSGQRAMDISNLSERENAGDRAGHSSLLETYIPIRINGRVVGAYEAYSDLSAIESEITEARRTIWLSVAAGFLLLFASLFAIVRSASRRLVRQMRAISALEMQAREAETLRQVDRLKDEFISGVSHELRRPLASIKGYTASLLLPGTAWSEQEESEFLQVIDEEADHLSRQIDDLLAISRLGSGSLPLDREIVYLPALTEQVTRRVRSQSHLPPHEYRCQFSPGFPYVEADAQRITQVLLNLLENAAKYSPPGQPIDVIGRSEHGQISVSVVDQGPGLSAEQAQRVFEKFYRVDSGLTRATQGTGLGLALCRGVIEAHGGQITVDSAPGKGCRFTFTLPAMPAQPAIEAAG
jgi:signal transduction histidine kinase